MTKKRTYAQKAAAYAAYTGAHPDQTKTQIHNHFAGTSNGMRKKVSLDLADSMLKRGEIMDRLDNSDMKPSTKKRISKDLYNAAKHEPREVAAKLRKHPVSKRVRIGNTNKFKIKKIDSYGTTQDVQDRIFKNHDFDSADYISFGS